MAVYGTDLLWGCPPMNFRANPPFNEMRQGFALIEKLRSAYELASIQSRQGIAGLRWLSIPPPSWSQKPMDISGPDFLPPGRTPSQAIWPLRLTNSRRAGFRFSMNLEPHFQSRF